MVDFASTHYAPHSGAFLTSANLFERAAEAIAAQVALVLCTDVAVVDTRGRIVASNHPTIIGELYNPDAAGHPSDDYWVPLIMDGHSGRVIASQAHQGEVLSSRLLKNVVDLVQQQVNVDWNPNVREVKDTFFHDLLRGELRDEDDIIHNAGLLGFDLATPYQMLVIEAAAYILGSASYQNPQSADVFIRRRAQNIISLVQHVVGATNSLHCVYIGNGEVILLRPCNQGANACCAPSGRAAAPPRGQANCSWTQMRSLQEVARTLLNRLHTSVDSSISLGLGRHHDGIAGLRRSYDEARMAIAVGQRFKHEPGIYTINNLGLAAFVGLSDERSKAELAAHILRALSGDAELVKTLATFFAEDCCPSASVKKLSIHRNTLSYRLDKIATLTGLDPRRFDDAVQLRLALLLTAAGEARPAVSIAAA
ncbi:MAG TPA: helix-turn-helix domain-containing protein [Herpetosiphonaceae bacterium]|nr:helix-turn-helix domain-containing protein [Herpetosiphonaceae bacterium]